MSPAAQGPRFLVGAGMGPRSRPPSNPVLAREAEPGTLSPTPACCPLGLVPRSRAGRRHRPQVKLPRTPGPDAACLCRGAAPPSAVGLGRLLHDPPEDCRSDGGSSSSSGGSSSAGEPGGAESSSSPRAPEREIPEPGDAEGPGGHLAAMQRPVARSKIKVWCRLCPRRHLHHALASGSGNPRPSLQLPPAHPGTGAPRHRARPPRRSCTCLWVSARAAQRVLPPAG